MDLDADGNIDILSGSYSLEGNGDDMAGLFQVLWGEAGGKFRPAKVLTGSDGKKLLLPMGAGEDAVVDRICTRPFAADLDEDGKLDIVSGNFAGNFAFFRGEGSGKFAPAAKWLEADGKPMAIPHHGDPFLIDWDGDGDLDLLSGSAEGGAFLFTNTGSKTAPRFAARKTVIAPVGHGSSSDELGDAHLTNPGSCTRVWCDDLNGDGKLDLLLGDAVVLYHAQKGVEPEPARASLRKFHDELEKLDQTSAEYYERVEALEKARNAFVEEEYTGFVWALYRR